MKRFVSVVLGIMAGGLLAGRASDVVWVDDAVPAGAWTGADGGDAWQWISSSPAPYSGKLAHQSTVASGIHDHYFSGATAPLPVNVGESLFAYVYLDPANPPLEVMLQWFDGSSWSHAAYWGQNLIPWGINGTPSQYYVGALASTGRWVRLEVPAKAVGLESGAVSGLHFIAYNGRATWDYTGKSASTVVANPTLPVVSLTAPGNGATVSGSSVTVSASASGSVGVQFQLDGVDLGSSLAAAPYNLSWDTTGVANGSHALTALAWDGAGNLASSASVAITVNNTLGVTTAALPSWVGAATHNWKPRLGGVYWIGSRAVVKEAAPYLKQSARPVLVDIKADATGFGYRFDLNQWDPQTGIHGDYSWDGSDTGTPASPEDVFQFFGATSNAEFVLNIPIPRYLTSTPSSNWGYDGFGYNWQTPEFYGAMAQYLFGVAGPQSEWQNLGVDLDFFSQPANFNWADLRARRGHVNPYPVVAIMIGEEPYNLEGFPDGASYGPQAERFRVAIRNRGVNAPLGLHVRDMGIVDDPSPQKWFWPVMTNVTASDFGYIDLEHYYQFSTVAEDFKRTFPVSVNPNGFQGWWMPHSTWKTDFTRFLWIVQDTRNALKDFGGPSVGDPNRWQLGFSEHGIQITSQFIYNDMFSALHWASWLAESMRQNILWDSGWTLLGEGYSTAQLQVRNGIVTRAPMFFVYQMAQEMYGLDHLANSYVSATGSTTDNLGNVVQFPWTIVRTLRDPASGNVHLFIANQSSNSSSTITGFENWRVLAWKQLSGAAYASSNPLGVAGPEPIQTQMVTPPKTGSPLVVPPISVNHITLSPSGNPVDTTPPVVSMTAPASGAVVSGSVVVSANASDNVGVTGLQFKWDGVNLGNPFTASPFSGMLDTKTAANGMHALTADAWDAAGNHTFASLVIIKVANTSAPPVILPSVSVVASVATAVIGTTNYGALVFTRSGSTSAPLTLNYSLGGTAVKWDDYRRPVVGDMPVSIVIPAGANSCTMNLMAVGNENKVSPETVTLTLSSAPGYALTTASSATITIVSNLVGALPAVRPTTQ